jgi:hypothetical protein
MVVPPARIFSILENSHSLLHSGHAERVLSHRCGGATAAMGHAQWGVGVAKRTVCKHTVAHQIHTRART